MRLGTLLIGCAAALALATPAGAVENPPSGISPSVFATQYSGCLGPLRSVLAQGFKDPSSVPAIFAHGFGPGVNPGVHQGTVGEEEFLRFVIGIPASELQAFCAQFT